MSRFTNATTATSSSFLQPPHQPQSSVPPSSFRGGSGIRSSLKKIPSSLFTGKTKETFTIHMDDPTATTRTTKSPVIPSFLSGSASPPRREKDTGKLSKTKKPKGTRKGLAEIFSWANSNSNNTAASVPVPVISAPSALVPSPPRLPQQKPKEMPRHLRNSASKTVLPGLSGWTSLRPPAETSNRARPSMGADPFSRPSEGAERVDQLNQCGELYERRGSVSSSKALSTKTLDSADKDSKRGSAGSTASHSALSHESHETTDKRNSITSSKAISTKTVDSDYTIRFQGQAEIRRARHMSPKPARATLVELPSRANSVIRKPEPASGTVRPIPSPRQVKESQVPPVTATLKKEKTKSKVWGLLGIKPKKSKELLFSHTTTVRPPPPPPARLVKALTPSKVPQRVSSINALRAQPEVTAKRAGSTNRLPVLHLTQPSVDTQHDPHAPQDDFAPPRTAAEKHRSSNNGSTYKQSRGVPKRKSLNGLFGLSLHDRDHFEAKSGAPNDFGQLQVPQPTTAVPITVAEDEPAGNGTVNTLRRVASATDKLVDLVTHFNFSPLSHRTIQPMESLDSIASTIKAAHDGSPTPMRKTRSGVLSTKTSASSPLRSAGPNVSPLKLALHRKQVGGIAGPLVKPPSKPNIFAQTRVEPGPAVPPAGAIGGSQPTSSVPGQPVKKNIFAPPTPKVTAEVLARQPVFDETIGMAHARPLSQVSARPDSMEMDVPQELRDLFIDADDILSATASPVAGLPQFPPVRPPSTVRRRRNPPPAPLPSSPAVAQSPESLAYLSAHINIHDDPVRDSVYSEFDFTSEFANLDTGNQRASFVEALHRVQQDDNHDHHDLPPLPALPVMAAATREPKTSTETVVTASARRSPFMGTFAFQQHASTIRASHSPRPDFMQPGPEPEPAAEREQALPTLQTEVQDIVMAEPDDTLQLAVRRRSHRRDESGLSIATMSSIGAVIDTGIAGEYTNYFEVEFARDNERRAISTTSTDEVSELLDVSHRQPWSTGPAHSRNTSVNSNNSRRVHARGHSRNASIASLASIDGAEFQLASGPPVSMHNRKRSSYISKHRRSGSSEGTFGRSDWAAHRRTTSSESTVSIMSAGRISRPGLGERMFQLDGGVQLTSITASPPEGQGEDESENEVEHEMVQDSLLGAVHVKPSYDSLLDASRAEDDLANVSASASRDSLFDADNEVSEKEREFKLRPVSVMSEASSSQDSIFGPGRVHDIRDFTLRPISAITTDSSSGQDDTFVNTVKPSAIKKQASCIEAHGEDNSTPVNVRRPVKPRSTRRRPAHLVFESEIDTPGLTSPSTSETSSRMSLETRFSEGPYVRPYFAGHRRQRSSAAVQPQATIKEEISHSNFRKAQAERQEVVTVRSYLDWEREADDEFRRTRAEWEDSEASKIAVSGFQHPKTNDEIMQFLTQSAQLYKPLEQQLPKAHRRKSSLSEARVTLSPYGLPLPKAPTHGGQAQKPRMSLITKFERTNSATSSHFSVEDTGTPPSTSAIFAQFTREHPPTPPPSLKNLPVMSPFKLSLDLHTGYSPQSKQDAEQEKRSRVTSVARRQALGWGKRRASDTPAKVVEAIEPVPRIPLQFAKPRTAANQRGKDKENAANASPTKRASPTKKAAGGRRVPRLASVPKGLRA